MKKGALIFAHNNREVDYALMALISGGLVKKNLNIPVTLVSDESTIAWMKESGIYEKSQEVFENIFTVEKPSYENKRKLYDGVDYDLMVPFVNSNRTSAWDLTPYDKTLLIDSDYLIFSDGLNEYWDIDDVLIASSMNDITEQRKVGYLDRYVSETGVHLYWATAVMFSKNEQGKAFFDMVSYVKENYSYYGDLFRFSTAQYRNDISFSVAKHILSGFETSLATSLPPILTTLDRDVLYDVDESGKMTFLISANFDQNYCAATLKGVDVHIMNKKSLVRNAEKLLRLI